MTFASACKHYAKVTEDSTIYVLTSKCARTQNVNYLQSSSHGWEILNSSQRKVDEMQKRQRKLTKTCFHSD